MICKNPYLKSALNAFNTQAQTIPQNGGLLTLGPASVNSGCAINAESTQVAFVKPGLYEVAVNADVAPAAAGPVVMNILVNGNVVAAGTVTGAESTVYHMSETVLVPVERCVNLPAAVTVQVVSAAGAVTVTNYLLAAVKLA